MNLSWLSRQRIVGDDKKILNLIADAEDKRDFVLVKAQPEERTDHYSLPYSAAIKNQGAIGSCFPAAQEVLTSAYEYKPISELTQGEYVFSDKGRIQRIKAKMKRKWQGNIYSIKTFGSYQEIRATPEHPFLTQRGWVIAKELGPDDYLVFTVPKEEIDRTLSPIEKDKDFLWLLGFYLAEGSIYTKGKSQRVSFSIHAKEDEFAERIKYILGKYGVSVTDDLKKDSLSRTVRFSNSYLANLLRELGGVYADKVRIHPRLMSLSPSLQMEIYNGWFDGDGTKKIIQGRHVATTISKLLAEQMQIILFRNGLFGTIIKQVCEGKRDAYRVAYVDVKEQSYRWFKTEDGFFAKITDLSHTTFMGEHVYNLSIEHDETYVVAGRAVHNCGSHAIASAIEVRRKILKASLDMPLSERWHYYEVRQKAYGNTFPKDAGQSLRDGLKLVYKEGIAPEALCPYDYRKYNEQPSLFADSFAHYFKIESYHRCFDLEAMKTALVLNYPIVLGIQCTQNFLNCHTYQVPKPVAGEALKGGHAILIEGYDDEREVFYIINSWGYNWGVGGGAWLPYSYVKKYLIDAWAVQ